MGTGTDFTVTLKGAGKKFFQNWIFRDLNIEFHSPEKVSILGQNGSGKSTLIQILSGYESLTKGTINFSKDNKPVERDHVFDHVSLAAPYLELIEEFTLEEILLFHFKFKKAQKNLSTNEIISLAQLESSRDKVFKYFSSGMKQRTKLILAMLSDVEMILLDEPLSNLDRNGMRWYRDLAENFLENKVVVVCSNQNESEYSFCNRSINIADYK